MNRRGMVAIAFGLGVIAAPIIFQMSGLISRPVVAEDQDLIVVDELDDNQGQARSTYLGLAEQKAALMTPEELSRETVRLRQELSELESVRKMRVIEQQLQQLIELHPLSSTAQRARNMLQRNMHDEVQPVRRRNSEPLMEPDEFPNRRSHPRHRSSGPEDESTEPERDQTIRRPTYSNPSF